MANIFSFMEGKVPFFEGAIPAGFPSPAADYAQEDIDLKEALIAHPQATFLVRVTGLSMLGAGILDRAILVVDRSLKATQNDIVIACIEDEFTVKRLSKKDSQWYLQPENPKFVPIPISGRDDVVIWGVVTACVNQFK